MSVAQAVDSLETWIEVYDNAVLNGEERPKAVELADEVVRVAGPYPGTAVTTTTLTDILKDYYVGSIGPAQYHTNEPGAVYNYDPYSDTYLLASGKRVTTQGLKQLLHSPIIT